MSSWGFVFKVPAEVMTNLYISIENDPDLRELAETEREHCLASMQEMKQTVQNSTTL